MYREGFLNKPHTKVMSAANDTWNQSCVRKNFYKLTCPLCIFKQGMALIIYDKLVEIHRQWWPKCWSDDPNLSNWTINVRDTKTWCFDLIITIVCILLEHAYKLAALCETKSKNIPVSHVIYIICVMKIDQVKPLNTCYFYEANVSLWNVISFSNVCRINKDLFPFTFFFVERNKIFPLFQFECRLFHWLFIF